MTAVDDLVDKFAQLPLGIRGSQLLVQFLVEQFTDGSLASIEVDGIPGILDMSILQFICQLHGRTRLVFYLYIILGIPKGRYVFHVKRPVSTVRTAFRRLRRNDIPESIHYFKGFFAR